MTNRDMDLEAIDRILNAVHQGHVGRATIFCDFCGVEHTADYTGVTSNDRFAAARRDLATNNGWDIIQGKDRCSACKPKPSTVPTLDAPTSTTADELDAPGEVITAEEWAVQERARQQRDDLLSDRTLTTTEAAAMLLDPQPGAQAAAWSRNTGEGLPAQLKKQTQARVDAARQQFQDAIDRYTPPAQVPDRMMRREEWTWWTLPTPTTPTPYEQGYRIQCWTDPLDPVDTTAASTDEQPSEGTEQP